MSIGDLLPVEIKDLEPQFDKGICEECGKHFKLEDCEIEEEGDWEYGYYEVYVCPECGGGLEYTFSKRQGRKWIRWYKRELKKGSYVELK